MDIFDLKTQIAILNQHADSPIVGVTLITAGFIPTIVDLPHLQWFYFAMLIPPAAWHLGAWFNTTVRLPFIKWACK